LNKEFKNFRRGVEEIPRHIEIRLGISSNAAATEFFLAVFRLEKWKYSCGAKIFGLLFIGYLNLV
jgi:hypothetical protein